MPRGVMRFTTWANRVHGYLSEMGRRYANTRACQLQLAKFYPTLAPRAAARAIEKLADKEDRRRTCPGCGRPKWPHPTPSDRDDHCVHGRPICTECSECGGVVTRERAVLGS